MGEQKSERGNIGMRLIRAKDYQDVSRKAANIIAAQICLKPDCVLGLATGSSPVGTYKELIAKYESGDLDFSRVKTVNLDEYVGLTRAMPTLCVPICLTMSTLIRPTATFRAA